MKDDNARKEYHPVFRVLGWAAPLIAIAVIAFLHISGGRRADGSLQIRPPAEAGIPFTEHADIDTLIAGGSEAFERGDYDKSARLLARARFFIRAGINEGVFQMMPRNLELVAGLSEHFRGYTGKGIEAVSSAAKSDPNDGTYTWYLALLNLSERNDIDAEYWLKKTVSIGGIHADSASVMLEKL